MAWEGSKVGGGARSDRVPVRAQSAGAGFDDATRILIEAADREVRGLAVEPAQLAVAEACIGLWERCIASATVEPDSMELAGVTPGVLALAGRALATGGNALFQIEVAGSMVTLTPASSWDPRGGYRTESRRYYLTMSGPQSTVTRDLPGDAVLHFKIGSRDAEWWRGRSPLYRSRATSQLAARIERAMDYEARIPVGRIVPLAIPGATQTDRDGEDPVMGSIKRGGVTGVPYGQGSPIGGEQVPAQRFAPQKMGPDPSETAAGLRTRLGQEIAGAFGVPPALLDDGADGTAQRESWRRFWLGTIAPIGRVIEAELRRKLDPAAMVSFDALAAADEDGRSRAIARRAQAAKVFKDMGLSTDRALRTAGVGE